MITAEQLKEAKDRVEALNRYLDIDAKKIQLEEEQLHTQAPGFWDDAKKAEEQMKKVKSLEKWIEGYKEVKTLVDELELAFDFYKEEMVTEQEVDEAYAKTIETVEALELKNMLRQEEDPMSCVLKINSGAGGTESRKQLENRENAMRLLRSQLYDRALQKRKAAQAKIEAGKKKIEWGSQIRSYVFDDRRVKDHRTGFQTSDVNGVMDGKIDGFIKAYLMEFAETDAEQA